MRAMKAGAKNEGRAMKAGVTSRSRAMAPTFKPCGGCPNPSGCAAAGKCMGASKAK